MILLEAKQGTLLTAKAGVAVVFISEDAKTHESQISALRKTLSSTEPALLSGTFAGKFQETLTLFPAEFDKSALVLVGLGKSEKLSVEYLRRAAATAAKAAQNLKATSLSLIVPDERTLPHTDWSDDGEIIGTALAEGAALALYLYNKYLTGNNKKPQTVKSVTILADDTSRLQALEKGVAFSRIVTEATCLARDLANAPPNEIYPDTLARKAIEAGRKAAFSVTVFDEKKIRQLKMGGVLSVAKGSDNPPRFIVMEYGRGNSRRPRIVLVGKGVTFDAGGISIKPAAGMSEMKMDMSGAAAVIATMQAVARLKLPLHVVGLVPSVENLLGGKAMKPGDIITHHNGKTSEVDNTDAEGRLILADALSYADRFSPDAVIDLATLTGHVVVALGVYATGMMGNDEDTMAKLQRAGERTYERVWQLPMFEEYEKLNKSDVADVKNSGGRPAGAISAAFFLKQFIGNYKWVHLDIAGTAILNESMDYVPKGGSGVGVRLLVDALRHWAK